MRKIVIRESRSMCFSPHVFAFGDEWRMLYACGETSRAIFEEKVWDTQGARCERWYAGGRNTLCLSRLTRDGEWVTDGTPVIPVQTPETDMMGPCYATQGKDEWLFFSARANRDPWRIFAARRGGANGWSTPIPILEPGIASDSEHVFLPSVLFIDGAFLMWYVGRDGSHRRIHHARSADGLVWKKYGVVVDCGPAGAIDHYAADCPSVLYVGGRFIMVYGAGTARGLAGAVSVDGVSWRKVGPILFRGNSDDPDGYYAFYPSLAPIPGVTNGVELYYAGEDQFGCWSILRHGPLRTGVFDEPVKAYEPSPYTLVCAEKLVAELPDLYREVTEDAHDTQAATFVEPANGIRQLRPSSTPVLLIESAECADVVKLGRSRYWVEREYLGYLRLGCIFPIVPMAIRYFQQQPVLIMPQLHGTELARLATSEPALFIDVFTDLLDQFCTVCLETGISFAPEHMEQPFQPTSLLLSWIEEILKHADQPWLALKLVVNKMPVDLTIAEALAGARATLAVPPAELVYFTGDNHLRNFMVSRNGSWCAIDLEFAGFVDIDFAVAKFIGSCIKHLAGITKAFATLSSDGASIQVEYSFVNSQVSTILAAGWIIQRLRSLPINPQRIRAYVLAEMRFRLQPVWEGSQGEDAKQGIAMAACAILLTQANNEHRAIY